MKGKEKNREQGKESKVNSCLAYTSDTQAAKKICFELESVFTPSHFHRQQEDIRPFSLVPSESNSS